MSKNKFDTANKKLINAGELISKYKLKRAKELIKEALELFKEINTHLMIAQCYYKLGIIYEIEGKWDKAEKYYFKSLEIRKEYGTSFKVADMNRLISRLFIFQKKWDKALQHAQIAFDILENDKDTYNERDHPLVQGESLFLLGTVYFQQNNYSSANFYYKLGLNKIHYNLNPTLFLDLKENLAHLYYKTGNYLKSINIYYEILDIEHQNKNHPVIINILLSLTMNFFHTNNIKKMRNLMVDANDIYNSIYNEIKENDTFLFNYNYKSGVIYRKLKNYIRGHEYAEKAIEIGDKLNDSNSKNKYENKSNKNKLFKGLILMIDLLLASYNGTEEEKNLIDNYISEAKSIGEELKDSKKLISVNLKQIKLLKDTHENYKIKEILEDIEKIAQKSENQFLIGKVKAQLGIYNYSIKDYNLAKINFEEAISIFKSIGHVKYLAETYYNIACVCNLMYLAKETLNYLRKAIELNQKYKEQAKLDKDFISIHDESEFLDVVK